MSATTSDGSTRWALIGASDIATSRVIPAIRASGGMVSVVRSSDAEHAATFAAVIAAADLYLTTVPPFDLAIRNGDEPLVTAGDGLRSLAAALAAVESLRTGHVVAVETI